MRKLSFVEVRAAGLPAHIELAPLTYHYRPLCGDVAVSAEGGRRSLLSTTHRVPAFGWLHDQGCACRYCSDAAEVNGEPQDNDTVVVW
jgi:hypothetical protein